MNEKEFARALLENWVETLIGNLDIFMDEESKIQALEKCGRACASHHGEIEKIQEIKSQGKNVKEILEKMNEMKMWCGNWLKKGDIIFSVCQRCGCPLVLSKLIKLSPTFCYCSQGWVKSVFEVILEKPVHVILKKAIGRGDDVCHFIIADENKRE